MLEPPARIESKLRDPARHWAVRWSVVRMIAAGGGWSQHWASREIRARELLESMDCVIAPAVNQVREALADLGAAVGLPAPLEYVLITPDGRLVERYLVDQAPREAASAREALKDLHGDWHEHRRELLRLAAAVLDALSPPRRAGPPPKSRQHFGRWPFLREDLLRLVDDGIYWGLAGGSRAPGLGPNGDRITPAELVSSRQIYGVSLTGDIQGDRRNLLRLQADAEAELQALKHLEKIDLDGDDWAPPAGAGAAAREKGEWLYLNWARDTGTDAIARQYDKLDEYDEPRGGQIRAGIRRAQELLDLGVAE